ncbi:MAG: type II toxin-antitoxin system RelE/ParE family toxin [Proteobacteria bacterium]|nr:type II toxin-antitoxin system RelE/ParE family toxin [Pseudomonadota bacterium]
MSVPNFLKGAERGRWSIWVNGNCRVTFEFRDGHAYILDYEDYHDGDAQPPTSWRVHLVGLSGAEWHQRP